MNPFLFPSLSRRDFLYGLTSSLGALAMTDLLAGDNLQKYDLKKPMHEPKAKNVIMLFMEGGPSQMDTLILNLNLTSFIKPNLRERVLWNREKSFLWAVLMVLARWANRDWI